MNEIGEILKKARIEKGYTLDDLQQITKIQKRYLEAIEQGNTDILPGRFYARAFIRQYADIVGLDGEELLDEHYQVSAEEVNEEFAESISSSPSRVQGKKGNVLGNMGEQLPTVFIFLLVAMILIIIYFAFRKVAPVDKVQEPIISEDNTEEVVQSETEEDETVDEEEDPKETEADGEDEQSIANVSSTGNTTTYEIKGPHPEAQKVVLTADGGDSWVSITVQGGASEAALLSDGESMSVDFGADAEQVDLVIGNAGFTKVFLNDTEIVPAPEAEGIIKQDWTLKFID